MTIASVAKNVSIAVGAYRLARWLRRLSRADLRAAFLEDVDLYRSLLPLGALCFDVGAQTGEKSEALLAAGGRVVAFEPNPVVLRELRARCGHHRHWVLVAAALGSRASIATLYAHASSGQSSLHQAWQGDVIGTYQVPVETLDSAIERFGRPAYCKIDVEGWELEVLKGLTQPVPLISFEFHLDEPGISRTRLCLQRLLDLQATHANLTPAERSSLHFDKWIPLDEFVDWFPGDLKGSLPGHPYGDIFVRNATD